MSISIFPISMGISTVYALRGDGVILIDGGGPNSIKTFKRGIENASIDPEEIKLIVLTHGHWDHIGSTKEIQAITGAKVLMHRRDIHFILDSKTPDLSGFNTWGKFLIALMRLYSPPIHIPQFEVDIVAGDDEISLKQYGLPGTLIHTPGHSWGSLSLLLDNGDAFVGDLAMNRLPLRLNPGLPVIGDDIEVVKESWRKILDMGVKNVFPAHGKPFPADIIRGAIG
jgi:glyoxylase-like metal-dependent hydrolase (beta-lactamase superfamily II)